MVWRARMMPGARLAFAGLLLGASACADDAAGGASGTASSSSGGASSSTATTGSSGPGATSIATGADTTAGVSATVGTTTVDGSSSGSPTTDVTASAGSTDTSAGSSSGVGSSSGSSGGAGSSGGSPGCGDGAIAPGEQCDGADLQGFDCVSLGLGPGVLACDPVACTFDTGNCGPVAGNCGNAAIDPGEQCDGADLQGFDCASLGLGGGTLTCNPAACVFDVSMCGGVGNCGNGAVDPGEQCDGADLQAFDCVALGFFGGALGCDPITCTFDTSMCLGGGGTSG